MIDSNVWLQFCFVLLIIRGAESDSEVSLLKETLTAGPICFIWFFCVLQSVSLTSVQFILRVKLCWYTIVHLLLEEFKVYLTSSLRLKYTIIMSHNKS